MSETADADLYRRAVALLEPGDVALHGAVVHTDHGPDEESLLHQTTLAVGDVVADHVGAGETYVYSGNDDSEFGVNQHQGLTLDGEEFVWECQQLLRGERFDVVVYWEATDDLGAVVDDLGAVEGVSDAVPVTDAGYGHDAR